MAVLFCNFVCLSVNFFSVKDFSATTWVRILKFGTKLDSDELYWVTKNILLISQLYCDVVKTVVSAYLNTSTVCSSIVPPLTYWAHHFKRQNRNGSFQYGKGFESQDVRNSNKSWLGGASLRYKTFHPIVLFMCLSMYEIKFLRGMIYNACMHLRHAYEVLRHDI